MPKQAAPQAAALALLSRGYPHRLRVALASPEHTILLHQASLFISSFKLPYPFTILPKIIIFFLILLNICGYFQ